MKGNQGFSTSLREEQSVYSLNYTISILVTLTEFMQNKEEAGQELNSHGCC